MIFLSLSGVLFPKRDQIPSQPDYTAKNMKTSTGLTVASFATQEDDGIKTSLSMQHWPQ